MFRAIPKPVNADLELPCGIAQLVDRLAEACGVSAVVIGGSRADGTADAHSDWDLGVYYRDVVDLDALDHLGKFYPPQSWGRIMNGGAWLVVDGVKVDVLLRDLAVTEHWSQAAIKGRFEIDALLGYLAGVPTYSLMAEHAIAKVIRGTLPPPPRYPEALSHIGKERWSFHCQFSLDYARSYAQRGHVAGAVAHAIKAGMEAAHSRLCARRIWVLNEKRLMQHGGLKEAEALFAKPPSRSELNDWLMRVAGILQ
jgi:predicted nucleotidyltransferase